MKTPVVFFIFNRPDTTLRVFEEIRKMRPSLLLVVADGPRENRSSDGDQCARTRAILEEVDWDCEIRRNYSPINLGCRRRVSSGIDWVFQEVEEAILLEDDCLPEPTFFRFCEELLERYRDDERIGQISGFNFQSGKSRTPYSYYFSRYYQAWGWASWRRAWKGYDVDMKVWPELREGGWLEDLLGSANFVPYWRYILERVHRGEIDTWDYQWMIHCWVQNRLAVLPHANLVRNLGFDARATHTAGWRKFKDRKIEPMAFPLAHPPYVLRDPVVDRYTEAHRHLLPFPWFNGLLYRFKSIGQGG